MENITQYIFIFLGLDDKFISVPRTRFFYKTQSFIRISAQPPNGVQPIEILWRQGGQRLSLIHISEPTRPY